MRSFIAFDLPGDVTSALMAVQRRLPPGRLVPEENLHLTLAFIADLRPDLEEPVYDVLSSLRSPPIDLRFGGLTGLGDSIIAIDVEPTEPLVTLQTRLQSRLRRAGVALPRRQFRPHITLTRLSAVPQGRASDLLASAMVTDFRIPACTAFALGLYQSTLLPEGPQYDLLADFPLLP